VRVRRGLRSEPESEPGCDRLVELLGGRYVSDAQPEVVDAPAVRADVLFVHGLDAVSVGVEHEGAVVAGSILLTQPGRAMVTEASLRQRPPELLHTIPRRRGEPDMHVPRDRPVVSSLGDRKILPLEEVTT
jgi:hypothetical protein